MKRGVFVRTLAATTLASLQQGQRLDDALLQSRSQLNDLRDQALLQELCYGVARWYWRLLAILNRLTRKPLKARDQDVQQLLLIGLYQLFYSRIPAHAALAATVDASRELGKPWAAGLINGVLRAAQRQQNQLIHHADQQEQSCYSAPQWLIEQLQQAWPEHWQSILLETNQRPPLSLRVNCQRISRSAYLEQLQQAGIAAEPLLYTDEGILLAKPQPVEQLPGFSTGLVSVQDGSAQLAAALLDPQPGDHVLDACAAPGGKSCHLLERTPTIALTALDIDAERLARISANLERLGLMAELIQADASQPHGAQRLYQRILLDVPCSATGVMRRHPDIKIRRQRDELPSLIARQAALLDAIWPCLSVGGQLLYATCSILPAENEQQIRHFLSRHADARISKLKVDWGHDRQPGRQILPGEQQMDGFYYARLEKCPS